MTEFDIEIAEIAEPKKAGRPKKYFTDEERKSARKAHLKITQHNYNMRRKYGTEKPDRKGYVVTEKYDELLDTHNELLKKHEALKVELSRCAFQIAHLAGT